MELLRLVAKIVAVVGVLVLVLLASALIYIHEIWLAILIYVLAGVLALHSWSELKKQ